MCALWLPLTLVVAPSQIHWQACRVGGLGLGLTFGSGLMVKIMAHTLRRKREKYRSFIARNEGFELNKGYTPPNVRYGNRDKGCSPG